MAKKEEIEARWAELSQRLQNDPKLAEVVDGLDRVLEDVIAEPRPRLKVPYVSATSLNDSARWN